MTWSLENLEQMVKNHTSSCSPLAFVNVWDISFIIIIMENMFSGKSVF